MEYFGIFYIFFNGQVCFRLFLIMLVAATATTCRCYFYHVLAFLLHHLRKVVYKPITNFYQTILVSFRIFTVEVGDGKFFNVNVDNDANVLGIPGIKDKEIL